MSLSEITPTLFRGQFDTFLTVYSFHFVIFVCFLTILVTFSLFVLYRATFGVEIGSEKLLGLCLY